MVPHHNEICGGNSLIFQPSFIDREPDSPFFDGIFADPIYIDIYIVGWGAPRIFVVCPILAFSADTISP